MTERTYREWIHADGQTAGAYLESEPDSAFQSSPDWALADSSGAAEATAEESGSVDGGDYSRGELNQLALEAGVENPEGLANKSEVADAINTKRAEAEATAEEG